MKLTFPILNTTINVPVDDTMSDGGNKKTRRTFLRKKLEHKPTDVKSEPAEETISDISSAEEKSIDDTQKINSQPSEPHVQPFLMAEVVNITHEKFRQTEEIKVCNVSISTVLNVIISGNVFYRL